MYFYKCVFRVQISYVFARVFLSTDVNMHAYIALIAPGRQGGRHSLTFVSKFCGCSRKEPPPGHGLIFDDSPALLVLKSKPVRVHLDRRGLNLKLAQSKQTGTGTGTEVHFHVMMHACMLACLLACLSTTRMRAASHSQT